MLYSGVKRRHPYLHTLYEKYINFLYTTYATSGVNQIWILKNSKELFKNLKPQNISQINRIRRPVLQTVQYHT
jgi:hypothetical protein